MEEAWEQDNGMGKFDKVHLSFRNKEAATPILYMFLYPGNGSEGSGGKALPKRENGTINNRLVGASGLLPCIGDIHDFPQNICPVGSREQLVHDAK
jgi:hypothetical protein